MAADVRRARRGWLGVSMRFLLRSLRVRATTHLFALTAITAGAAVTAIMLTLRADLGSKMSHELRRYGPNLLLTAAPDRQPPLLDEAAVRSAAGARPAPLLIAPGGVHGPGREPVPAAGVVGADLAALRALNPSWRVEGDWPGDTPAALVGEALAGRAGLRPGDAATIDLPSGPLALPVSGLVATGEAEEDQVLVPLATLQQALGLEGRITLAAYAVDGGPDAVDRAGASLAAAVPGSAARPLRPIAAAQGAVLARLERMMLLLTLVVLTLSGLCLATTLMAMVVEREPEIGLMRAMGAGDRDVLRMVVGEATLLGAAGGAAGLVLGAAGAHLIGARLFGAAIALRAGVAPWVLLIALGVSWIAVVVPLRRALAIRPAMALRAE